jgi:hypothetical protein
MARLWKDAAASTLASSITTSTTSITLATGEGVRFPAPTGLDFFILTLEEVDGSNVVLGREQVMCTARVGDVLTVTRAQEDTVARAAPAGTRAELRITAAAMAALGLGLDVSSTALASIDDKIPTDAIAELVEAIEAQRMALQALVRTIGQSMPDTAGRLRVLVDSISASLTLATITTVGTVTTVSTLTNQTQIGGLAATEQIPSLMRLGADSARRNINVT